MKENFNNFKWFWKDAFSLFERKKWYLFPYFVLAILLMLPFLLFISIILLTEDSEERKKQEEEINFILNQYSNTF